MASSNPTPATPAEVTTFSHQVSAILQAISQSADPNGQIPVDLAVRLIKGLAEVSSLTLQCNDALATEMAEMKAAKDATTAAISTILESANQYMAKMEAEAAIMNDDSPEGYAKREQLLQSKSQQPNSLLSLTMGGRNILYQAVVDGNYARAKEFVAIRPDLAAEIEPQWQADMFCDAIMVERSADDICWLVETLGVTAMKAMLANPDYDILSDLLTAEYVPVLQKMAALDIIGQAEYRFIRARAESLAHIGELVFGPARD